AEVRHQLKVIDMIDRALENGLYAPQQPGIGGRRGVAIGKVAPVSLNEGTEVENICIVCGRDAEALWSPLRDGALLGPTLVPSVLLAFERSEPALIRLQPLLESPDLLSRRLCGGLRQGGRCAPCPGGGKM